VITETTAVTLRQNLGDMLNRVQYRRDSIVITKDGKPVAALVDAALFERIRRMQDRFDALSDRLAKACEGVEEDAGMAQIERASAKARVATADEWRAAGRLPPLPASGDAAPRRNPATRSGPKGAKAKPTRLTKGR
jgi:prevent-host-death family protein